MAETGYSLDIKDLRRRLKDTFLLLACCDGDNAYPAFDEYGHGAMILISNTSEEVNAKSDSDHDARDSESGR